LHAAPDWPHVGEFTQLEVPVISVMHASPPQQSPFVLHAAPALPQVGGLWQEPLPSIGSIAHRSPAQQSAACAHAAPAAPHTGAFWQLPPVVLCGSAAQPRPEQHVVGDAARSHAAPAAPHVAPLGKSTFTVADALRVMVRLTTAGEVPVTVVVTVFDR
jgi:hypothetical protein